MPCWLRLPRSLPDRSACGAESFYAAFVGRWQDATLLCKKKRPALHRAGLLVVGYAGGEMFLLPAWFPRAKDASEMMAEAE